MQQIQARNQKPKEPEAKSQMGMQIGSKLQQIARKSEILALKCSKYKPDARNRRSQKPKARSQKTKMPKKMPLQSKLPTYQSRTTECSGCIPGASSTVLEAESTLDNDIVPGWLDLIASKKAGERSNQSGPLLQCHDLPSLEDP